MPGIKGDKVPEDTGKALGKGRLRCHGVGLDQEEQGARELLSPERTFHYAPVSFSRVPQGRPDPEAEW